MLCALVWMQSHYLPIYKSIGELSLLISAYHNWMGIFSSFWHKKLIFKAKLMVSDFCVKAKKIWLRTPREEIAFTARPKIHSQSQIFRYGRSIFCLPHGPNFSDIFDCLHWVSVVRGCSHVKKAGEKKERISLHCVPVYILESFALLLQPLKEKFSKDTATTISLDFVDGYVWSEERTGCDILPHTNRPQKERKYNKSRYICSLQLENFGEHIY